jgi:hypothetical protein
MRTAGVGKEPMLLEVLEEEEKLVAEAVDMVTKVRGAAQQMGAVGRCSTAEGCGGEGWKDQLS